MSKLEIVFILITIVGLGLLVALFKGRSRKQLPKNLMPEALPRWDCDNVPESLAALLEFVEKSAKAVTEWYWAEKGPKARASRIIQALSLMLTGAAGLLPIVFQVLKEGGRQQWWMSQLWPSALVGAAVALLGLDRAFGFSSAWARYVLAATEINRRLAEFRMDWMALSAAACAKEGPAADRIAALIQKAKEFRVAVEDIIVQETKEWATEFRNNMSQLEKDVKAQLETLKTKVEKTEEQAAAQRRPRPTITTDALPDGKVTGVYQPLTVAAAGGTPPYQWAARELPAGLAIDAGTGAISGTPTAAGSTRVTITVTDSVGGTDSKTLPLTVS